MNNAATKPWWQSKTVWGCAVAAAGAIGPDLMSSAGAFGPTIGPAVAQIGHLCTLAGIAWAAYGRFAASTTLT